MTNDESVNNILGALYHNSPVIKMYVDAIRTGKGVPYTILMRSDESEKNQEIVERGRNQLTELLKIKPEMRDSEIDSTIDILQEILDEEFVLEPEEGKEYEVIMFKGDAVVESSKQITSDMDRIKMLKQYADSKGYEFSCAEVVPK